MKAEDITPLRERRVRSNHSELYQCKRCKLQYTAGPFGEKEFTVLMLRPTPKDKWFIDDRFPNCEGRKK